LKLLFGLCLVLAVLLLGGCFFKEPVSFLNDDVLIAGIVDQPFSITELKTDYGLRENTITLEVTDLIDKAQYITNISELFAEHPLTDEIEILEVLLKRDYQADVYGYLNESQGKYKTLEIIEECTVLNETDKAQTCVDVTNYYDNKNNLLDCDSVLRDKSCMKAVYKVVRTETKQDFFNLPTLKEKIKMDGLKIEQKQSGLSIPLPKGETIYLKLKYSHPLAYQLKVPMEVNKYDIVITTLGGIVILDPTWYSTWNYRKEINISNTAGNQTNYQILVELNLTNFNYSHANITGQDIRFENSTYDKIDYWIETWNASGNSSIWVEVPFLENATNTTIYLYYGNSEAESLSNGTNTMIYYDEIVSGDAGWDSWGNPLGFIDTSVGNPLPSLKGNGDGSYHSGIGKDTGNAINISQGVSLSFDYGTLQTSVGRSGGAGFSFTPAGSYTTSDWVDLFLTISNNGNPGYLYFAFLNSTDGGKSDCTASLYFEAARWYDVSLNIAPQMASASLYIDGDFFCNTSTYGLSTSYDEVYISVHGHDSPPWADNIRVHRFVTVEPVVVIGNEEEQLVDTHPQYSDNSTNSTVAGKNILHSLKWTDDNGLSGYIFQFCNGTWNGTACEIDSGSTPADWSDSDYVYRECFNVTENSGGALTDFQINYTLDTETLIDDGKMESDCHDIRVYDNGADTALPYWFKDSNCNDSSTELIFQTNLTASEVQEVCVYYDYSSAVDGRSGNDTFDFFEDFSGDLSQWNIPATYSDVISIESGRLRQDPDASGDAYQGSRMNTSSYVFTNGILEYTLNLKGGASRKIGQVGWRVGDVTAFTKGYNFRLQSVSADGGFFEFASGTWSSIGTSYAAVAVETDFEMRLNALGSQMDMYQDGSLIKQVTDATTSSGGLVSHLHGVSMIDGTDYLQLDDIRVRQLIASMPTTGAGIESNNTGGVTGGWVNDSWVVMGGTANWSNVSKPVNSTVGTNYSWCVYANDTSDNWNSTSCDTPFSYVTTDGSVDPCAYTSGSWELPCGCNITEAVDVADNNILITGSGVVRIEAPITGVSYILSVNTCSLIGNFSGYLEG